MGGGGATAYWEDSVSFCDEEKVGKLGTGRRLTNMGWLILGHVNFTSLNNQIINKD